jgi:hypothetical protein
VRAAARLLEAAAALFLGAGLLRVVAGPLRFEALGEAVSIRTAGRPLAIALTLLCVRLALARAVTHWRRRTNAAPGELIPGAAPHTARLASRRSVSNEAGEAAARVLVCGVLAGGVLAWFTFLSDTCGGADSYGYVSAAHRVLSGTLVQHEPLAASMPFDDGITAATPLGYTPSPIVKNASVPVYPLGLPALMAFAITVGGNEAVFLVAPITGLLLLVGIYVAALYVSADHAVALVSAALAAVQPVVFTYAIQPMSDVPAAACFIAAYAALLRATPRPTFGGVAAGMALLIRPALAPALFCLAAVPYLLHRRRDARAALAYLLPLASALGVQLGVQWYLYGSPFATGYAELDQLFSFRRVATNLRSHGYWAWHALTAVWVGAAALGLTIAPPRARLAMAVVIVAVPLPYLAYRAFDHWETLRFLLPALLVGTITAAWGIVTSTRLVFRAGAPLAAAVLVAALSWQWWGWLEAQSVLTMPEHERRYRLAGELVSAAAPADAVVLADLHSGSVRYYTGRQSINWSRIPAGALTETVGRIQAGQRSVFLLLDGDEERRAFETRHGTLPGWLPAGQRRTVQLFEAPTAMR